jgi:hypothetical protein
VNKTEADLIGKKLHEFLKIKEKIAVSIIGNFIEKKRYDENYKKYELFLNNLLKVVRSSDSCLISGDCRKSDDDIINLSELIGKKLEDNPYYDSKEENKKIQLIGVRSIHDLNEKELFSNKIDESSNELPGDSMLSRYHTDFIFANTVADAQTLRLNFEMQFDYVIFVLINVNLEELEYLDKVILSGRFERFKIIYVTVSLLIRSKLILLFILKDSEGINNIVLNARQLIKNFDNKLTFNER